MFDKEVEMRRKAFSLVEVLVVLAILGVLVALLVPAIQAARQASNERRGVAAPEAPTPYVQFVAPEAGTQVVVRNLGSNDRGYWRLVELHQGTQVHVFLQHYDGNNQSMTPVKVIETARLKWAGMSRGGEEHSQCTCEGFDSPSVHSSYRHFMVMWE